MGFNHDVMPGETPFQKQQRIAALPNCRHCRKKLYKDHEAELGICDGCRDVQNEEEELRKDMEFLRELRLATEAKAA